MGFALTVVLPSQEKTYQIHWRNHLYLCEERAATIFLSSIGRDLSDFLVHGSALDANWWYILHLLKQYCRFFYCLALPHIHAIFMYGISIGIF